MYISSIVCAFKIFCEISFFKDSLFCLFKSLPNVFPIFYLYQIFTFLFLDKWIICDDIFPFLAGYISLKNIFGVKISVIDRLCLLLEFSFTFLKK